ncbi:hypothetical protein FKM82_008016 [Ascaphus truei]
MKGLKYVILILNFNNEKTWTNNCMYTTKAGQRGGAALKGLKCHSFPNTLKAYPAAKGLTPVLEECSIQTPSIEGLKRSVLRPPAARGALTNP